MRDKWKGHVDEFLEAAQILIFNSLFFYLQEIRRRGSKDLLKVCVEAGEGTGEDGQPVPLQIYDVPFKGGGEGDKAAVTPPERDSRPPTEYELLWEWRKEPVIKTLSGTSDILHMASTTWGFSLSIQLK